jgi:hypothetical protein
MGDDAKVASGPLLWIGILAFLAAAVLCTIDIWHLVASTNSSPSLTLTSVMMVGLVLIVALMILLLIFYKVTGIEDKTQALGLPVGSVRALIAFSLVLMFVCVGVFLYQGVNTAEVGKAATNLTQKDVDDLKARFNTVVSEPANPAKDEAGVARFNVTYYPTRSKEADDFAKQMFTQLATVFVTVIGFYFGSSTAAAGVGAGVAAAGGAPGKPSTNVSNGVPAALQEAKALAHDADSDMGRLQNALTSLQKTSPPDEPKLSAAEKALDDAKTALAGIQSSLDKAKAAAAKFGTASSDADNSAAADDVIKARDAIKPLAATVKADADKVEALLK